MKVKNSIKKVGAVAGSALMVGLTMGSAATLGDYPQPFVGDDGEVNSQIVVGSEGKVADVVGAVNLAAGLGQNAVQTETRTAPGASNSNVDGEQYDVALRGDSVTQEWLDKSSYSQLARDTVQDSDGNDHRVLEQIRATSGNVNPAINGTDILGNVGSSGSVQYRVSYTPGFGVEDSISVLGDEYEITDIDSTNREVALGSKMSEESLALDDSYEHGPYTLTVIDKDEGNSKIYLQVAKNGDTLTSFGLNTGETRTLDDGALQVTADEVFYMTPENLDGSEMNSFHELSNGLYVNTNLNRSEKIRYILRLASACDLDIHYSSWE